LEPTVNELPDDEEVSADGVSTNEVSVDEVSTNE
jgi:hypothetical protein